MKESDKEKVKELEIKIKNMQEEMKLLEELFKVIDKKADEAYTKVDTLPVKYGRTVRNFIIDEVKKSFNQKFAKELMKKLIKSLAEEL